MTKKQNLIIIGVGETAEIAYEYFTHDSDYQVVSFAVNQKFLKDEFFCGLKVYPLENLGQYFSKENCFLYVAIGSNHLNRDRTIIYQNLKKQGYKFATYVSSKAFVWQNVLIGENCFIFENNVIQSNVRIGNNVTLWSGNHIGHRSIINDNCFISSHVVISGFCEIGKNSFIGVNSCIADNIKIAEDNFIGIGSIINKNTENNKIFTSNFSQQSVVSAKKFCKVKEDVE